MMGILYIDRWPTGVNNLSTICRIKGEPKDHRLHVCRPQVVIQAVKKGDEDYTISKQIQLTRCYTVMLLILRGGLELLSGFIMEK